MHRPFLIAVLLPLLLLISPGTASAGRGPVLDFDIVTEQDSYEANVSDPAMPSTSFVVTVKNTGTIPSVLSVRLSVSVNLGGTATVSPAQTPYIAYQGQATAVVSVTLPDDTPTSLIATLRIDGVCEQNSQVTDFKQVLLTVRQWHSVRIQNFTLSSNSPVEREMMQVSARVRNIGNGPTFVTVAAFLDGAGITAKANGVPVDTNMTVKVDPGRFLLLTADWKAGYGHHSVVLEAQEVSPPEANNTTVLSHDSRMAAFFVTFNTRDWIPYLLVAGLACAVAGAVTFRYRKRLAARFPRFGRTFHIRLPAGGPRTKQFQRALGSQVKRARGVATRVGQRPLPKYVSRRVRSDIDKIRARAVPRGPPPGPEEIEKMKPVEKGRFR